MGAEEQGPQESVVRSAPRKAGRGLALVFSRASYWAPVLLALAFLVHVAQKSLKPALKEQHRLQARDAEMRAREERQLERLQALETEREALDDPIYQERIRRLESQTGETPRKVTGPVPYSTQTDE